MTYQWQRSGDQVTYVDLLETTNSILLITNFQASDVAYYRVIITNAELQRDQSGGATQFAPATIDFGVLASPPIGRWLAWGASADQSGDRKRNRSIKLPMAL